MDEVAEKLDKLIQTVKQVSALEFLKSLLAGYEKYGRLSDKQAMALEKFWENRDRGKMKKMGLE